MNRRRGKRIVGSVLLLLLPAASVVLLLLPGVREPLGRALATVATDAFASPDCDPSFPMTSSRHVKPGHPVFLATRPGGLRPVAYVTAVEPGAVRIRFAKGEDDAGDWRLLALPAARGLGDAWRVAVPDETARELGATLSARLQKVLDETILPELHRRMPSFLARIDPRKDPQARKILEAVGGEIMERLRPYVDSLVKQVTKDLEDHFDLLDRLGLLWKVVRGDGGGLGRKLVPVAERSLRTWWANNRDQVLTAVGHGVAARAPEWQAWLTGEVWSAAREELAEPIFEAQRKHLEREAEDAIGDVLEAVVRSPDGGFRTRFAAVLRSRLLEKDEPLLLLEPVP